MSDWSKALGDSIFNNRKRLKMTQAALAECAGVTEQTIRKIEHGEGNPQWDVLVALIKALQIDPAEIFYPSCTEDAPARKQLKIMLADCTDDQIASLIPIFRSILEFLKGSKISAIK